jgi:hypothetical protein
MKGKGKGSKQKGFTKGSKVSVNYGMPPKEMGGKGGKKK